MTSVGFHSKNSAFKVPLPRQPKQDTNKASCEKDQSENSAEVAYKFLALVQKLISNPHSLTKHEILMLRNHPVIGQLIEQAAKLGVPLSSFYLPVESILNPYANDRVKVYFRPKVQIVMNEPQKQQEVEHENNSNDSTSMSHASEHSFGIPTNERKVGFYTQKERQEKIRKFKEKKARALEDRANKKVKYLNKSEAAKRRLRVKGKFVKA